MQSTRLIEELSRRVEALLASNPGRDVERNVRALLQSSLARLDLVPREEFDVQSRVLARAREKLAELEARIAELERRAAAGD